MRLGGVEDLWIDTAITLLRCLFRALLFSHHPLIVIVVHH